MSKSDPGQAAVAAARRLFEYWHVPAELLAEVVGVKPDVIEQWAESENWRRRDGSSAACSAGDLYNRFIAVFAAQLDQYRDPVEGSDMEKQARALSGLAKALEIITAVGIKLGATTGKGSSAFNGTGMGSASDGAGTEELDRELTKLLQNLIGEEPLDPVPGAGDRADQEVSD